jgi:hypothetical protein
VVVKEAAAVFLPEPMAYTEAARAWPEKLKKLYW